MRILYLGWEKGSGGGGVLIYTESLLKNFAERGHDVSYLYVGGHNLKRKPYLKLSNYRGIKYVELFNSKNDYLNLNFPLREIKENKTESVVLQYIKHFNPDIIHIQNLMGFSSSIIEVAADLGYPIIVSHHNYWFICPRIELLRSDGKVCEPPYSGLKCAWCCSDNSSINRLKSLLFKIKRDIKGTLKPLVNSSQILLKIEKLYREKKKRRAQLILLNGEKKFSSDILRFEYNYNYLVRKRCESNKLIRYNIRSDYHRYLLNNKVYLNLAVSTAVKDILLNFGISEEKILVKHIGTRAAEFIKALPKPPLEKEICFGFLGPLRREKGVHILLKAYSQLKELNCSLRIYGPITDIKYFYYLKSLAKESQNVNFMGPYEYEHLSEILQKIHYLIVPPIWFDNAPQVVFEALASKTPVIGAKIGGIPDFVVDNENGLLFKAGDIEELSRCMMKVIKDKNLIKFFQEKIKPMKTMKDHLSELEGIYNKALSKK